MLSPYLLEEVLSLVSGTSVPGDFLRGGPRFYVEYKPEGCYLYFLWGISTYQASVKCSSNTWSYHYKDALVTKRDFISEVLGFNSRRDRKPSTPYGKNAMIFCRGFRVNKGQPKMVLTSELEPIQRDLEAYLLRLWDMLAMECLLGTSEDQVLAEYQSYFEVFYPEKFDAYPSYGKSKLSGEVTLHYKRNLLKTWYGI